MDRHRRDEPGDHTDPPPTERAYGDDIEPTYQVIGEPVSVPDAEALAAADPYQFQWWALGLVGAHRLKARRARTRASYVADLLRTMAIPGRRNKLSSRQGREAACHPYVRGSARGVVEREQAALGVLLTLNAPTRAMRTEAASAGFYASPWGQHPRVQILTVGELLAGNQSWTRRRRARPAGPTSGHRRF